MSEREIQEFMRRLLGGKPLQVCVECIKEETGARALHSEMVDFEIDSDNGDLYFKVRAHFPDGFGLSDEEMREKLSAQIGEYALIAFERASAQIPLIIPALV